MRVQGDGIVNLGLLLLLAAGPVVVLIGAINRLHALPISERILSWVRHAHFVAMATIVAGFVVGLGCFGPRLLTGGSWSALTSVQRGVAACCALAGLGWLTVVVARRLRPPVPFREGLRTERIDVAAQLSRPPIGTGLKGWLVRLPLNESLLLETTERTYRHPRLPPEWDGLTILHFSDLHLTGGISKEYFEHLVETARAQPADLVVFTGDLLDDAALLDWIPAIFSGWTAPLGCWFVLGNHDHERSWGLDPDVIRRAVADCGWRDATAGPATIVHRGRTLTIAGTEQPWGPAPAPLPPPRSDDFRILLSHTPDLVPRAREQGVDLMLAGHVHGGQVVLPLIGPVYCPSTHGCRFHGGDYWEPPVLLHVSRGISGRDPLRWRCPPELARIVLRSGRP